MSFSPGRGRRDRGIRLGTAQGRRWAWAFIGIAAAAVMGSAVYVSLESRSGRLLRLREFWADPAAHADWQIRAGGRCGEAPFVFPTDGYVGFVWGDSFRPGHAHQGLDIFGPTGPDGLGQTPVVAAYDGYLTRRSDWRSAVIIRIPQDPLQPGRQIWTYYTHMADAEGNSFIDPAFPPGTSEQFVRAGTLLGTQGNYSADPMSPTGMHLHFSIVRDDGEGRFLNELEIGNTLDPSSYLGIEVNAARRAEGPPVCESGEALGASPASATRQSVPQTYNGPFRRTPGPSRG